MNHLDEGTIHAWLDAALDSAQSGEIDAHLAQCATCSAAVAEARGLVAGASRILNALDDVPANVVPKRAPAQQRARRQWRAAPWVTGIAAALILAIGITQLNTKGARVSATMSAPSPIAALPEASVGDTAQRMKDASSMPAGGSARIASAPSEPPATAGVAMADERRARTRSERRIPVSEDVARRDVADARGAASDVAAAKQLRAGAGAEAARAEAVQRVQAAPPPSAPSESPQSRQSAAPQQMKFEQVVVTSAPTKGDVSARDLEGNASTDVNRLAGCYRVAADTKEMAVRSVAKTGNVVGRAASATAAAADRPAAARYVAPAPPDVVRLDTVQKPLGYVVRAGGSDSTTIGWWSRFGPDTARVRLSSGIALTVAGKNRVSCPER